MFHEASTCRRDSEAAFKLEAVRRMQERLILDELLKQIVKDFQQHRAIEPITAWHHNFSET